MSSLRPSPGGPPTTHSLHFVQRRRPQPTWTPTLAHAQLRRSCIAGGHVDLNSGQVTLPEGGSTFKIPGIAEGKVNSATFNIKDKTFAADPLRELKAS
jgi:hypothetical protein